MSASAAHVATSSCLEAFGALQAHRQTAKPDLAAQVPDAEIEDEFGRFRLWAANIGALSRGHGSLDYRLRDAPVVLEGALKLLNELRQELHQMCLVLSGERLPYEAQISSGAGLVHDSDTSSLSSDSESSSNSSSDGDDEKPAPSELRRRVSALSNINDNLYRLSRSIRAPASHSRSLKALSYKLIDKETGVDVVQQFAPLDLAFTRDVFSQLRQNAQDQYENCQTLNDADLALIERLAQGITRRRQQFRYWRHHRKKLGFNAEKEGLKFPKPALTVQLKGDEARKSVADQLVSLPVVGKAQTESSRPKTTLTETTATLFIAPTTVLDGNQSVTSYATTARGLDGSRIEFPKLPKSIKKGKDFECPYCQMICPSHYQMPRAWRAHLLRDLRPYMCTHKHCPQPDELFATKQEWLNHEHTHQKAWQCPEHASTYFSTQDGLKGHLLAETHESLQRMGLEDLLAICETVRPDSRTICPICFVKAGSSYGLEIHLANHLERFAAFALPRDIEDDADEESAHDSNMSEHAIARSDQSDASDVSYAFAIDDKRAEIEPLLRKIQEIYSNGFNSFDSSLNRLSDQMIKIENLTPVILDKLNIDLQFKAVFKTIPKLLMQLEDITIHKDDLEDCKSELIFQMDRLDSIFAEYMYIVILDSSPPRLGTDTSLVEQSLEDGRKQTRTDTEPALLRDGSPDGVINRTGPRFSTMDINRHRTSEPAEEATSPVRDSSPDSIERAEREAPKKDDLAGYYYGYVRPPNSELAPMQHTLRGGRADGAVDVVDESRWTKINRRFVSPEALDQTQEKYDEWDNHVIVHRILSREELDTYTKATTAIRAARVDGKEARVDREEEDDDTSSSSRSILADEMRARTRMLHDRRKDRRERRKRMRRDKQPPSPLPQPTDFIEPKRGDNERDWSMPDSWLSQADNMPLSSTHEEKEPRTNEGFRDSPRPLSAMSSIFDDDVIINPHTLPRGSIDTSHYIEGRASSSHQPAKIDNKRLPRKNYSALPPISPSAHFNPSLSARASSSLTSTTTVEFLCTFAFAGCDLVFTSKDAWKQHVVSNHMSFVYWECPLKPCPRPLFHREDLLEEHLRWVHSPPLGVSPKSRYRQIAALIKRGERPGRRPIMEISCPVPGCIEGWRSIGDSAWDERMEHVARHWEAVAKEEEVGGWTEEGGGLLEWAIRQGAVREGEGGKLVCDEGMGKRAWNDRIGYEARHLDSVSKGEEVREWTKEGLGPMQPKNPNDQKKLTYDDASGPWASSITPSHRNDDVVLDPFTFPKGLDPTTPQKNRDGKEPIDDDVSAIPPQTTDPTTHLTTERRQGKLVDFGPENQAESHRPSSVKSMTVDYGSDGIPSDVDIGPPMVSQRLASLKPSSTTPADLDYDAEDGSIDRRRNRHLHRAREVSPSSTQETTHRDEGSEPLDKSGEPKNSTVPLSSNLYRAHRLDQSVSDATEYVKTSINSRRTSIDLNHIERTLDQQLLNMSIAGSDLPCIFRDILGCPPINFDNYESWSKHIFRHFGLSGPPPYALCIFCDRSFEEENAIACWNKYLEHINEHFEKGKTLDNRRLDFRVLKYLRDKGLITNEDYDHFCLGSELPSSVTMMVTHGDEGKKSSNFVGVSDSEGSSPSYGPVSESDEGVGGGSVDAKAGSGDEAPLDEKRKSRLKRIFSRRNWTEKGKGEQKGQGKGKDKEEDDGGGRSRGSLRFLS
ncbi:hypothetical protein V493_06277 [Pseudogymnoascus sp. VKM F-4281 (FW-2241)]|nr:hypothetical protein V493_06277 [Pseudogymnoascus sp. VKM F-4281 (FW-2241)]